MTADYRFRIGDLICHTRYRYRGVIVGSDPVCVADEKWYQHNQTQPDRDQPWYHVLVHGARHSTYAAQANLDVDLGAEQVVHPMTRVFFGHFSAGRYHPRPDADFPGSIVPDNLPPV